MIDDILILAFVVILPALIMLKSDKQAVHLLEGKLHKRGQDISLARATYSRHKEPVSFVVFCVGVWILVSGVVAFGTGLLGISVAAAGGICALFGVLGRVRSFLRADQELG